MRYWSFGLNSLPQFRRGNIHLEEMPWWLYILETINDYSCGWIPDIPLPDIWPKHRDKDNDIALYTLRQWYGGTRDLWHLYICSPIFQWIWHHPKRKMYMFDVGYDKAKEVLYEDFKKTFDEHESYDDET